MYIILLRNEDLNNFLRCDNFSKLDSGAIHNNLIKILKCFSDAEARFNRNNFYDQLKHYLRSHRLLVVESLNSLKNLQYSLAIQVSDNFPYESVLDKTNIERDHDKIIASKDEVCRFIEQIQNHISSAQSPSIDEKNLSLTGVKNSDDTGVDKDIGMCSAFTNFFKGFCSSHFFYSAASKEYQLVKMQVDLTVKSPQQIRSFAKK